MGFNRIARTNHDHLSTIFPRDCQGLEARKLRCVHVANLRFWNGMSGDSFVKHCSFLSWCILVHGPGKYAYDAIISTNSDIPTFENIDAPNRYAGKEDGLSVFAILRPN